MIVDHLHIKGIAAAPTEYHSPLVVDPNRVQAFPSPFQLLETIATQTGGASFMAHNARDMRRIYETIDRLERSEQEMPVFSSYEELFPPFATLGLCGMLLELFLSSFVWLIL